MHSTNYVDTLICPAEDCLRVAVVPDKAGSIALLQYELLAANPYGMTSDDVLSKVAAQRQGIDDKDFASFRTQYFSKGQPCFRASPLTKTHGWAVHSNSDSRCSVTRRAAQAHKEKGRLPKEAAHLS